MDKFQHPVIMVSHPRSGRNWLRYMIERAFAQLYGVQGPVKLGRMIHMSHDGMGLQKTKKLRYMTLKKWKVKKYNWEGRKVIFVLRDPRDAVISNYYLLVVRKQWDLRYGKTDEPYSLSRFVRDEDWGIEPICRWLRWWVPYLERGNVFQTSYEDMLTNTQYELTRVLEFLPGEHDFEKWMIEAAVSVSTFEKLRAQELDGVFFPYSAGTLIPGKPETMQFRRGVAGGWKDELDQETMAYCREVMTKYLVGISIPLLAKYTDGSSTSA